jgi:hypothetical protein
VREGSTTVLRGARQTGKSSLLARAVRDAHANGSAVVDFDFQLFDKEFLATLGSLLRYLADAMTAASRGAPGPEAIWASPLGVKDQLTTYVEERWLRPAEAPFVLVLDEVDRVLGRPYQDDFFGLLRAWHNLRAKGGPWRRLNLVMAISTDPARAIQRPDQSPFNVGVRVTLDGLSPGQVQELNRRYGMPIRAREAVTLHELTAGHPYLVQQALHALAGGGETLATLADAGRAEDGPFADHLRSHRVALEADEALRRGVAQVLANGTCPSYAAFSRLRSIGLVTGSGPERVKVRCPLYRDYLGRLFR